MNPRPIIITSICAILFVAAVYFGGQHTFEQERIDDAPPVTSTQMPTTPSTSSTPTESTDNGDTVAENQTETPAKTIDELHRERAELKRKYAEKVRIRDALKQCIAADEQIIAEYEAEKKASEEQEKQIEAELEVFNQWLHMEILPEMSTILPDIMVFFDGSIEPTVESYIKRFPDPADQRYYASKLARYQVNLDKIIDYVTNTSELFREEFIRDAIARWGEEGSEYLVDGIREKLPRSQAIYR